ncbi:class I SAM-dependent methyltransferase [Phycisphaera mikurensis]|uniref:Methyltransferase type 11 domain-containing protein n=1 Tax=Phycisphaera mikurensis (strain NBRC 102666 / KCTC 22515 / FYK2301M01) TaxID=1142394 RepID=I0ICA2_PHYMF|nr:class I SAM-dependent methyltransferase [Phycisphaera mikurensis]MBB6441891.1 hypothetical protein [Phycisphaera mikurensis]BAM02890.1 hypothetical protein PSMK_07310 [Phycisphaera mikurensis NBRC 102666]
MANARKKRTLAERADKYRLYQLSVQGTDADCDFFEQAYREAFGGEPRRLWEDFAGAFAVCCAWVKRGKKRTAVAVDLDPEPLAWGRANNLAELPEKKAGRIEVLEGDCLDASLSEGREPADVVAAQNFSFWIFRTRAEVTAYFRTALVRLGDEGVVVLDMMGGTDCTLEENVDERAVDGAGKPIGTFTYLWEQVSFNPITHDAVFRIGFRFRDGSSIPTAFRYAWRFWSIPEVREMLLEAGFADARTYWSVEDENREDTGAWAQAGDARQDPAWLAYVVGVKRPPVAGHSPATRS